MEQESIQEEKVNADGQEREQDMGPRGGEEEMFSRMLHKIKSLDLDDEDSKETLIHLLTSLHSLSMWCFYRYQEHERDLDVVTDLYTHKR
jgi:hypothetical protein